MWLFVTARNTLLNFRRSTQRRDSMAERLGLELAGAQEQPDPAEEIAELSIIRQAIAALDGDLRELVTLVHWEGFTLVEASTMLGIPASTTRSRYAKARSELKLHVEFLTRAEA